MSSVKYNKKYVDEENPGRVTKFDFPNQFTKIISQLPRNSRVLDIGVRTASLTIFCHQINSSLEYHGIDLEKATNLPTYLKFKKISCEDMNYSAGYFDFVICSQILEHMIDPQKTMAEIKRVLKKGGMGIICVPHYRSLFLPDGLCNFYCDYGHVRPFTKYSLNKILKDNDLIPLTVNLHRNIITMMIMPYLLIKSIWNKEAFDHAMYTLAGAHLVAIFKK